MELIDIGCNLTHDSFGDDLDEVVAQARAAGVVQFIVTGASNQGMQRASELARERPGIFYSTAGVHPHHADTFTEETETVIRQLVEREEVVAVGETGLDYFRDFSPRDAQRSAFERHIGIAADTGMPMFLHLRDAHEDFHAMLRESRDRLSDVVVHCFTGSREELHAYLDLDCHIGITGWICDERRGTHMKNYLGDIPADRLMIETDAPYLKPRNLRPKVKSHRNEPRFLPWILGTLAAVREEHPERLAAQTTENARRFFRIPAPTL
jgi:TatD DNase family protein